MEISNITYIISTGCAIICLLVTLSMAITFFSDRRKDLKQKKELTVNSIEDVEVK